MALGQGIDCERSVELNHDPEAAAGGSFTPQN
jgi:hypothetical protein